MKTKKDLKQLAANAREYRKTYEKTPKGYLSRKYHAMNCRVNGIGSPEFIARHKNYMGLPLLSRQAFYLWALENKDFKKLFDDWKVSGFEAKLCPTVDRIDPKKGYVLSNMRWLTRSKNSSLGNLGRPKKRKHEVLQEPAPNVKAA